MTLRTALALTVLSAALFGTGAALTQADGPSRMVHNATDVTGTYSWTMGGGGGGGGGGETTLTLKQEGNTLAGTITGGRGGEQKLENGTVDGNSLKFNVTREFNGNKFTTHYEGTVDGETLKLKIITTREVEAKKKAL